MKIFKFNFLLQDIFSVVSAQIDCSINPFLPPVEELHNFIEHLEATEIDVILKEGKLYLSGSWNSIAFIRVSLLICHFQTYAVQLRMIL